MPKHPNEGILYRRRAASPAKGAGASVCRKFRNSPSIWLSGVALIPTQSSAFWKSTFRVIARTRPWQQFSPCAVAPDPIQSP